MLPPKVVPDGLTLPEYQRLLLQYQILTWMPQMAKVSKILVVLAPPEAMPEDQRRKMTALMTAVQASVFVTTAITEVENAASEVVKFAASQGGKLLDKNEVTKAAKDKVSVAFGFASQLASSAVHKVLEDVVLPHVGLPVHYVPEGGTAEQYLTMAKRFEIIGYCEPMRQALKKASVLGGESGKRATIMLKTRVPLATINSEATSKFVDGLKCQLTKKEAQAKAIYTEILRDCPEFDWVYPRLAEIELVQGDEPRARDLLKRAIKQNPDYLLAWRGLCNLNLANWQIDAMQSNLDKMKTLDPQASEVSQIEQIIDLINQGGMR